MSTLDARYGRTRGDRRRGRAVAIAGGAVLLLLVVGWSVWSGLGGAIRPLDVQTGSADIGPRSVTVHWQVNGRAGERLVCAIEAQDAKGVVVGLVEQIVPVTGRADREGSTLVRTVRPATDGLIDSCRAA